MPYISIQSFPKDEETKKKIVEKINEVFLEVWGCPQKAITISMEEVDPADWQEKVIKAQIEPNMQNMCIVQGEKVK
ncbi:MAG: tautomerase family protein [Eubacteriales bacterium]|nr:tautomerase family protein [Eubacteriales bacterium]